MGMSFLDLYNHVLPKNADGSGAEAFKLTRDTNHENLYSGLSVFPQSWKDAADALYFDLFPDTTRALDEWSKAFDLWPRTRTEQEVRDALTARWQDTGGQSPSYLQSRLQAHGYDVYVHDWWADDLPANEALFDFGERCYYVDGFFPGTSYFREQRLGRAFKAVTNELREYEPRTIRDGGSGLLIEPERTNYIRSAVNFGAEDWTLGSSTLSNTGSDPVGGLSAFTWTPNSVGNDGHLVQETSASAAGKTYTASVWLRGSGTVSILLSNNVGNFSEEQIALSSTWTRYTITHTFDGTAANVFFFPVRSRTADTATSVQLYGAQVEEGDFATSFIPFTDGIIDPSSAVVEAVRYDTRDEKVSDSWRFDATKSWYGEPLGTDTRGRKREFPQVVDIVVTTNKVTIYDATEPDRPMWMVINPSADQGINNHNALGAGYMPDRLITSVKMLAGVLRVATTSGNLVFKNGLVTFDFVSDTSERNGYNAGSGFGYFSFLSRYNGNIEQRHDGLGFTQVNTTTAILSGNVNDVDVTIRPNAGTNTSTGMPYQTIMAGTSGGVSIINPEGTAVGANAVVDLGAGDGDPSFGEVFFDGDRIWIGKDIQANCIVRSGPIIIEDTPSSGSPWVEGDYRDFDDAAASSLPILGSGTNTAQALVSGFVGNQSGLTIIDEDVITPSNGMVAYVTANYNTGFMQGDAKISLLNSRLSSSNNELFPTGNFDSSFGITLGLGVSISGGNLIFSNANGDAICPVPTATFIPGRTYRVETTIESISTGAVRVLLFPDGVGSGGGGGVGHTSPGTYVEYITLTTSGGFLENRVLVQSFVDPTDAVVSNISVTEVDIVSGSSIVENGDFSSGTDWVLGTGFSISGGLLVCDGSQTSGTNARQLNISVKKNTTYKITYTVPTVTNGVFSFQILDNDGSFTNDINRDAAGTFEYFHTTGSDTSSVIVSVLADENFVGTVDNVSVVEIIPDRSVASNDMDINGTLNRVPMGRYSEMTGLRGFASANYLEMPYSADFDFGTGDFYISCWMQTDAANTIQTIVDRWDTPRTGNRILLDVNRFSGTRFGIGTAILQAGNINDGERHHILAMRRNGIAQIWLDGVLSNSAAISQTVNNSSAVLRVGLNMADTAVNTGVISMLRMGGSSLSSTQIQRLYQFERRLFEQSAGAFINGTSNSIEDISVNYDASEVYIATSDGVSMFDYASWRRVNYYDSSNSPLTSDNMRSTDVVGRDLIAVSDMETVIVTDDKTRQSDDADIPTTRLPSSDNDESTIVARVVFNGKRRNDPYFLSFNNASNNNNEVGVYLNNSNQPQLRVIANGQQQADISSGQAITAGTAFNVAIRNKENDFAISVNGSDAVSDTDAALPASQNVLSFGRSPGNVEIIDNGTFIDNVNGWTGTGLSGGGVIEWDAGTLKITQGAVGAFIRANQSFTTTIGVRYNVVANVTSTNHTFCSVQIGTTEGNNDIADSANGGARTINMSFVATTETTYIALRDGGQSNRFSNWDNVSIKEDGVLEPDGSFVIEQIEYLPLSLTDDELKSSSLSGPKACPVRGDCLVNISEIEERPFVGECGETVADCGEETVECGNTIVIPTGSYPFIRNPKCVINDGTPSANVGECGDPSVLCGAEIECGDIVQKTGSVLVNKILESSPSEASQISCGEPGAECGEPFILAGQPEGFKFVERQYIIPSDVYKWPYFVYVGGQNWPEVAQVPVARKDEFETTIIKLFPNQNWVGLLVEYV